MRVVNFRIISGVVLVFSASALYWAERMGFLSGYSVSLLIITLIYCILAVSWNVISGYAGYTSFGHVAFFGVGAYVATISVVKFGFSWLVGVVLGGLASVSFSLPAGIILLRLRGPYFAIGTLVSVLVLRTLAMVLDEVTGGSTGMFLPPVLRARELFYTALFTLVALQVGILLVDGTPFGLRLKMIRDDEEAAEVVGIDTVRYKVLAFLISAFAPGVAGGISAYHVTYISPDSVFDFGINLEMMVAAMLGGLGTVWGPIAGAVILRILGELLWARYPNLHLVLYGFLIIFAVKFLRRGVIEALSNLLRGIKVEETGVGDEDVAGPSAPS